MWTIDRVEVRRAERRFGRAVYVLGRWLGEPREDKASMAVLVGEEWVPVPMDVRVDVPASLYLDDEQMGMLVEAVTGAMPRQIAVEEVLRDSLEDTRTQRDKILAMLETHHRPQIFNFGDDARAPQGQRQAD